MLCILWNFKVCGVQYVGSARTLFRLRFNNYKACNRKFIGGSSGKPQADFYRHFAGKDHHGFLEDIKVTIIDRLNGNGRIRESLLQYKLETLRPRALILG